MLPGRSSLIVFTRFSGCAFHLDALRGVTAKQPLSRSCARVGRLFCGTSARVNEDIRRPRVYKPLADAWALYDSSQPEPVLLDWGEKR